MLDETGISDDFRKAVESGINEDMLSELAFEIKDFISDACEHFEETPTEDHVHLQALFCVISDSTFEPHILEGE